MAVKYGGEKRPAKKCLRSKHLPGILSMSHDFFVCEYCHEVFDWIIKGEEVAATIEMGNWPGDDRKMADHEEFLNDITA